MKYEIENLKGKSDGDLVCVKIMDIKTGQISQNQYKYIKNHKKLYEDIKNGNMINLNDCFIKFFFNSICYVH